MMLDLKNIEYVLKRLLFFLLFFKGFGVGDRLDKIMN